MDKQSFVSQITILQEPLRRFLLVLTHGDSDLADDLAQEAMLRAYLYCSTFREASALSTWIYRIAYNLCLDHQKSYWTQHRDAIDDSESVLSVPSDDSPDRAFLFGGEKPARDTCHHQSQPWHCHIAPLPFPQTSQTIAICFCRRITIVSVVFICC